MSKLSSYRIKNSKGVSNQINAAYVEKTRRLPEHFSKIYKWISQLFSEFRSRNHYVDRQA